VHGLTNPRRRAAQAGISLIETLVALVLGLTLVSVAFNLYVSNRSVFRQIEAMTRLQESASIAAALLETEIRHAAGVLCRKGAPMTNLLRSSADYEVHMALANGVRGYASSQTDGIAGTSRLAGDSLSIYSANAGAVARVTASATATSDSYTFTVDDASNFSAGTVALACDYDRAVLFQVTGPTTTPRQITFSTTGMTPGNCGIAIRASAPASSGTVALPRCTTPTYAAYTASAASYTFGPGSLIGKYSFSHWYIGAKTSTDTGSVNNRSLRRVTTTYSETSGVGKTDEEMVENVSDMQITYLVDWNGSGYPGTTTYVAANAVTDWTRVIAVRMVLTLTSPERVGLAAGNVASAATYTLPLNVTIRARMPGVLRR
jgi:type IV pilus assembly protein PilW